VEATRILDHSTRGRQEGASRKVKPEVRDKHPVLKKTGACKFRLLRKRDGKEGADRFDWGQLNKEVALKFQKLTFPIGLLSVEGRTKETFSKGKDMETSSP